MSEIWKRKIKTWFKEIDFDEDGVVSKKDNDCMVEGLVALKKNDPVQQEKLRKIFTNAWLKLTGSTKTYEKEFLTEALLIDSLMKQGKDPQLVTSVRDICCALFDIMDINKDGNLQLEEFSKCGGGLSRVDLSNTSLAEHAFKFIDTNHDGKINLDEYTHAFLEFVFSHNEHSPYNYFFGYLLQLTRA